MTNAHQHTDDPDEDPTDHVDETEASTDRSHLDDVEDGCGCTEIWEHLSENREETADD